MKTLTQTDLQFVVSRLPKDVRGLAKKYNIFVGGGFIRETIAGGDVNDIDIFGEKKEFLQASAEILASERNQVNPTACKKFETDNAITLLSPPRLPVQFITRWLFSDPKKLVESFDFTVCQAIVWMDRGGSWNSLIADDFYPDLAAKRLVYTFPQREEEAGGSMLRVRKFLRRGYNIQAESLAGVIARLVAKVRMAETGSPLHNERNAAKVISSLLREVDPLAIIEGGGEPIDEHEILS